MTKHISILRGINVGGKRKILMADLKSLYSKLGYKNVISYIQSGNVIFDAKETDHQKIEAKIYKAINKAYGFEVPVVVRSVEEIKHAVANNPFAKNKTETESLHLTFLKEIPSTENLEKIATYDYSPDKFKIIDKDVFLICSGKYHKSKLTNNFFEKKLKVAATTRNWKTVNKLLELSQEKK